MFWWRGSVENEFENIIIDDENNFELKETNSLIDYSISKFDYFNQCWLVLYLNHPIDYFRFIFWFPNTWDPDRANKYIRNDFIQNNKKYLEKHPYSNVSRWNPTTIRKINEVLAVFIIMGINRFTHAIVKLVLLFIDQRKKDNFLGKNVSKILSFNKYSLVNKFLHLSDNKKNGDYAILKYRNFYLFLKTKSNKYYIFVQELI